MSGPKYQWRKLSPNERKEVLSHRRLTGRPWHSPPHRPDRGRSQFHITAACFDHQAIIGATLARMDAFACELVRELSCSSDRLYA